MNAVLALLAATALGAAGWETVADPQYGGAITRPTQWPVEVLDNEALLVQAPAPLQGSVAVLPVSVLGAGPRALVGGLLGRLGAVPVREAPLPDGHAALVHFVDPATPAIPRTALVAARLVEGKGALVVLSAPSAEWDAARPALTAIAQSLQLQPPQPAAPTAAAEVAGLRYEPFAEPKEQAFAGELPAGWKRELSVAIVPGAAPYVRASAVGRSAENLYAFVHYKLASFQAPAEGLAPGPGVRPYQPGAEVLEGYLFPAVAQRSPAAFGDWKLTRRSGPQPLFAHASGVRFDGEEVEYAYRYKGEAFTGRAYVTTYHLPGSPSASWYLYGLFGWEAPEGRAEPAQAAGLRLLRSFGFHGRYAPQADLFWSLARDAALRAFAPTPAPAPAPAAFARRDDAAARGALEAALLGLAEVRETPAMPLAPVRAGVAAALDGGPGFGLSALGAQLEAVR